MIGLLCLHDGLLALKWATMLGEEGPMLELLHIVFRTTRGQVCSLK